jgi:hypothetical protein
MIVIFTKLQDKWYVAFIKPSLDVSVLMFAVMIFRRQIYNLLYKRILLWDSPLSSS